MSAQISRTVNWGDRETMFGYLTWAVGEFKCPVFDPF